MLGGDARAADPRGARAPARGRDRPAWRPGALARDAARGARGLGGYATAGAVGAAYALAVAAFQLGWGRRADRRGAGRVIRRTALAHGAALALFAALADTGPTALLIPAAAVAGACFPPVATVSRAAWREVEGEDARRALFALDGVTTELTLIAGPLLATALTATTGAPATVALVGALVAAAALVAARSPLLPGGDDEAGRVPARRALVAPWCGRGRCAGGRGVPSSRRAGGCGVPSSRHAPSRHRSPSRARSRRRPPPRPRHARSPPRAWARLARPPARPRHPPRRHGRDGGGDRGHHGGQRRVCRGRVAALRATADGHGRRRGGRGTRLGRSRAPARANARNS